MINEVEKKKREKGLDYMHGIHYICTMKENGTPNSVENDQRKLEDKYLRTFRYLYSNKAKFNKQKKEDEEFYYADVEGTRSQFTKAQLKSIQDKYDIPISTKLTFSIVQQMLAFITGSKPYAKLIAVEESAHDWIKAMEPMVHDVWEENCIYDELKNAEEDMFVTGSGYLAVRENSFYRESTYGVNVEHVPWSEAYIDPASKRPDLKDADVVCIAKGMPLDKAEKEYGIKLDPEDTGNYGFLDPAVPNSQIPDGYSPMGMGDLNEDKHKKWIWIKRFYEKITTSVYTSPEGYLSLKAPTLTSIPNPNKQALMLKYQQAQESMLQVAQQDSAKQQQITDNAGGGQPMGEVGMGAQMDAEQGLQSAASGSQQLQVMGQQIAMMPDYIPAYKMELENGEMMIAEKFIITKHKRVKSTLQVDRKIIKQSIEPTDELPLIHFNFAQFGNPNKTYGIIHWIKDIVKALNKLWGLSIFDLQLRTSFRMMAAEGSIDNAEQWEKKFAVPGSLNFYTSDPQLPDGGRPQPLDMSHPNQSITQLITMLVSLSEYITGIFGVIQGNGENAPETFGATQSLQSFGTQRIKLTARAIESPLNLLIYNIVKYMQKYCDPEVVAKYMDENQDGAENAALRDTSDMKFKVKTSIVNSLPSSRQMFISMMSTLAGQAQDPMIQQLLMKYSLQVMDMKEADEMAEQMDIIQKVQGQMQQMQQQNDMLSSQLKAAQNNMMQKDLAVEREKAKGEIATNTAVANTEIQMQKEQALEGMDPQGGSGVEDTGSAFPESY